MKKFYITVCLLLLTACSYDTIASIKTETLSETEEAKDEAVAEKAVPAVVTEGKEKMDTVTLKEESLFKYEVKDADYNYNVFVYAENAEKKDVFYSGHYAFYLAEKDSTVAYKQNVLKAEEIFTFKTGNDEQIYPLKVGNKTIFAVAEQSDEVHTQYLFTGIDNGELKLISQGDIKSLNDIKIRNINQKYIQTIRRVSSSDSIQFTTWGIEKETLKLVEQDKETITDKEEAAFWLNSLREKNAFYYPFKDLDLNADLLAKAKQGIPVGSPYPLGTNIQEIKKSEPNYMQEGVKEDGPYVMYPEITYYYNAEDSKVTAAEIPGDRLRTTLADAEEIFRQFGETSKNDTGTSIYLNTEKYQIEAVADQSNEVKWLRLKRR
ncbi:hypothetical protein [Cytobacillus gottheilii]|uniref:hypothetical protein n=1 Tax=Cytobacillus gottheilii TaxID=859144 RepID=UPI0009BB20D6|nr:hypothetical protein [Cytobacillus gottheilii]